MESFSIVFKGPRDNLHHWVDLATTKEYGAHIIWYHGFDIQTSFRYLLILLFVITFSTQKKYCKRKKNSKKKSTAKKKKKRKSSKSLLLFSIFSFPSSYSQDCSLCISCFIVSFVFFFSRLFGFGHYLG